jgi:hypothetical protein
MGAECGLIEEIMTIGDIMAIVAAVFAVIWTLSTSTVLIALIAPSRVQIGVNLLVSERKTIIKRGIVLAVIALFSVTIFHLATAPLAKLILTVLIVTLGGFALYGSAVIATIISSRLTEGDAAIHKIRSLYYSALLCLIAAFAPIIGWLLIAPSLLVVSLGAGSLLVWPVDRKPIAAQSELIVQKTVLS